MLTVVLTQAVQAQTYTVLHDFTGGADGAYPYAGVTLDKAGNLYGTAFFGGDLACDAPNGCGTVYKLTHKGSGWTFNTLYSFAGGSDGANPTARVIFGPDGTLYGTTSSGGSKGVGTVFNLRPSPKVCKTALCPWTETVLYSFKGGTDGASPWGEVVFDQTGNIYGTTENGGDTNPISHCKGCGVVFELTPSNGDWIEGVIYAFSGSDGKMPLSGVVFDDAGNLYGTTFEGGLYGYGTDYELTPSGSGWTESFLYSFTGGADGNNPYGGLIFDPPANLYGDTAGGFPSGPASVFKLTRSGGTWTFSLVYSFTEGGDSGGPRGALVTDGAGNLYGTTEIDPGNGGGTFLGSVFELTPSGDGTWTYTSLHGFTGPDGEYPYSNVVIDANGNLYGTTSSGGLYGYGVVWQITP